MAHEQGNPFEWGTLLGGSRTPTGPPRARQPSWVNWILLIYGGLFAVALASPVFYAALDSSGFADVALVGLALAVLAFGTLILILRVGQHVDVPDQQRSIIGPLLGSATLAVLLAFGIAVTVHEFVFGPGQRAEAQRAWAVCLTAFPLVWLVWVVFFGLMSSAVAPSKVRDWLSKSLYAGSVLELLIAIPMHLVVRGRGYCCAGFGTGLGIGVGMIVMLIAIGPAVAILCAYRYRQVYARKSARGSGLPRH